MNSTGPDDLQTVLISAIRAAGGAGATTPGSFAWARSMDYSLWPCKVVGPDAARSEYIIVDYFSGRDAPSPEDKEIHAVPIDCFVAWGGPYQHVVEFCSLMSSVLESSSLAAALHRSIKEANRASGGLGATSEAFQVAWSEVKGYPLWPCVVVPLSVANYFLPESLRASSVAIEAPVIFLDDHHKFDINFVPRKRLARQFFGRGKDKDRVAEARLELECEPKMLQRFEAGLLLARRLHAAFNGEEDACDASEDEKEAAAAADRALLEEATSASGPSQSSQRAAAATGKRRRSSKAPVVPQPRVSPRERRNAIIDVILAAERAGAGVAAVITNLHDTTRGSRRGLIATLVCDGRMACISGPSDESEASVHAERFGQRLASLLQLRLESACGGAVQPLSWADVNELIWSTEQPSIGLPMPVPPPHSVVEPHARVHLDDPAAESVRRPPAHSDRRSADSAALSEDRAYGVLPSSLQSRLPEQQQPAPLAPVRKGRWVLPSPAVLDRDSESEDPEELAGSAAAAAHPTRLDFPSESGAAASSVSAAAVPQQRAQIQSRRLGLAACPPHIPSSQWMAMHWTARRRALDELAAGAMTHPRWPRDDDRDASLSAATRPLRSPLSGLADPLSETSPMRLVDFDAPQVCPDAVFTLTALQRLRVPPLY